MDNIDKPKKDILYTKDWSMVSSQVSRTWYNETKEEFTVQYKGKGDPIWKYYPIAKSVWDDSVKAESIGKFINTRIKPSYACKKIS